MQRNPESQEELKLDTDDDCDASFYAVNRYWDEGSEKDKVLDILCDAEAGMCLDADDSQLVLGAFEQMLLANETANEMYIACARGALEAFGIQPPAIVLQFPVAAEPAPTAA